MNIYQTIVKALHYNIVLEHYTHVYGLGEQPSEVTISNLEVRNQCDPRRNPVRYFVRNGELKQWNEGLWSMTFVGYNEGEEFKLPEFIEQNCG